MASQVALAVAPLKPWICTGVENWVLNKGGGQGVVITGYINVLQVEGLLHYSFERSHLNSEVGLPE